MTSQPIKKTWFVVALVLIQILAMTGSTRADLLVQFSADGQKYTSLAPDSTGNYSGFLTPDLKLKTLVLTSSNPGTAGLAQILVSTLDLVNNSNAIRTLYLKIGATGFLPGDTALPSLLSNDISGKFFGGNPDNALTFSSIVDPKKGPTFTAGNQALNTSKSLTISSLTSQYSLTQYFQVTLGKKGEIKASANTQVGPIPTATPEPGTIAAALTALPLLGLWFMKRRRAHG